MRPSSLPKEEAQRRLRAAMAYAGIGFRELAEVTDHEQTTWRQAGKTRTFLVVHEKEAAEASGLPHEWFTVPDLGEAVRAGAGADVLVTDENGSTTAIEMKHVDGADSPYATMLDLVQRLVRARGAAVLADADLEPTPENIARFKQLVAVAERPAGTGTSASSTDDAFTAVIGNRRGGRVEQAAESEGEGGDTDPRDEKAAEIVRDIPGSTDRMRPGLGARAARDA